jgi:hypothetical protein
VDAATETVHGSSSTEVIDVQIVRIVKEKDYVSGDFDDVGVVRDRASNDAENTERVEV